jgi:hypothetical protein
MSETSSETGREAGSESFMDIYDRGAADPDVGLACLVCGALVSSDKDFPRVHWDWHEASNGA